MTALPTYREALRRASSLLETHGKNRNIAQWLSLHLTQQDKLTWLSLLDQVMETEHYQTYHAWVDRVLHDEPYQYIVGQEDFYGRTFHVNPSVLIPRPETELLIDQVRRNIDQLVKQRTSGADLPTRGIDVGTGSGCIAITLALELSNVEIHAVDISTDALQVAEANAQRLGATVHFMQSDLLSEWTRVNLNRTTSLVQQGMDGLNSSERLHFIVSNPPYIPFNQKEIFDKVVVEHEPHLALFAEQDGLAFYRRIVDQAKEVLLPDGFIAFEVGIDQAKAVVALTRQVFPEAVCQIIPDYQGIERMVVARLNQNN